MVNQTQLKEMINERLTRILLVAQTALHDNQFQAFRRIVLDEFGRNGLEKELEKLERHGTGRNKLR